MTEEIVKKLNELEITLIEKFKAHPVFVNIELIPWNDFLRILVQRRFLSLSIVNIYELVIDSLTDETIKKTVRSILNDEYPRDAKGIPLLSHRELLFQDLLNLGATREMILTTPETFFTTTIKEKSYQLITDCLSEKSGQIGILTFLRFWAEVLVSIEYECLWKRISERLSDGKLYGKIRSEFYYFHMLHDARNTDVGKQGLLGGLTHSQELAIHLQRSIWSEDDLLYCIEIEKSAYKFKYQFYDQFIAIK